MIMTSCNTIVVLSALTIDRINEDTVEEFDLLVFVFLYLCCLGNS
jgi:hypothetical protein